MNSELKVQLIEKIINGDDAFLKRLDGFIKTSENRLEVVSELIRFNEEKWLIFAEIFSQKTKKQIELYELIKNERKLITSEDEISESDREYIELILIIGVLDKKLKTNDIIEEIIPLKSFTKGNSGPQYVSRARKIFSFIQKYDVAKNAILKGILSPDALRKYIIDYDNDDMDEYLLQLLLYYDYISYENEEYYFHKNIPKHKSSELYKKLSKTDIENFNKENPGFKMPSKLKDYN